MAEASAHIAELKRQLGQRLADLRKVAGVTQGDVARHAFVDRTYVSHAECGRQVPEREFWAAADDYLRAEGTLLGTYDELAAARHAIKQAELDAPRTRLMSQLQASTMDAMPGDEAMRRRHFLTTLPAVAVSGSSLSDLVAAATAQAAPPPRRVGIDHVEQVWELNRQADLLDHRYGGGLVTDMLAAQVRWAAGLFDAHVDRATKRALHSAVGHL